MRMKRICHPLPHLGLQYGDLVGDSMRRHRVSLVRDVDGIASLEEIPEWALEEVPEPPLHQPHEGTHGHLPPAVDRPN